MTIQYFKIILEHGSNPRNIEADYMTTEEGRPYRFYKRRENKPNIFVGATPLTSHIEVVFDEE